MRRKIKTLISLFLSVVLLVTMVQTIYAASNNVVSSPSPLEVVISTDKSSYSTLGMALITISVTNTGTETVNEVTIENIIPESLMAFGADSFKFINESMNPGETVGTSFEVCLNPNNADIGFFSRLLLRLKIYFKLLRGSSILPLAVSKVAADNSIESFDTTKDITFGKITVAHTVRVFYLPSTVSEGPVEDAVSLYNAAANATKAYTGEVAISKTYGTVSEIIEMNPSSSSIKNLAQSYLPNDYPMTKDGIFVNGISGEETLLNFLPPKDNEKMSTLSAAGVKFASIANIGSNRVVILTLTAEQCSSLAEEPQYHSTCMDTLKISDDDLLPFKLKSVNIIYTGATITAVINKDGCLSSLEINEPVVVNVALAYSSFTTLTAGISGVWRQNFTFTY